MSVKKFIIVLFICCTAVSCVNHYSKEHPIFSRKTAENLYHEGYFTSGGGVFATDTHSNYLTDSITFRKFIGVEYDYDQIRVSMITDNLVLIYVIDIHTKDTLQMDVYSISQLRKEGKWE